MLNHYRAVLAILPLAPVLNKSKLGCGQMKSEGNRPNKIMITCILRWQLATVSVH